MGAAEAVTDKCDGFIVPPREQPFREAVELLMNDPALRRRVKAEAARRNSPRFSQQHSVDALLNLYAQVAAAK